MSALSNTEIFAENVGCKSFLPVAPVALVKFSLTNKNNGLDPSDDWRMNMFFSSFLH